MLGCQNRKKPFKLSPGSTTSGDDGKLASSASTQHVSEVAKVGFHVELRSIHIYLCDRSIVNRSSLITASWTNIVWFLSQSSINTTDFLCTQYMHCEHWIEFTPTLFRHTAQGNAPESRRRSSPGPETMSFVFFMMILSPLCSIPSFHTFNLAMHSSSESAITARYRIQKHPLHTSTELARQSFQPKYEKQGAENRFLMHTNSNPNPN